ncbi:MAG: type II toxin-antitoxin system RelE/ParE family toxin [Pseudomonadota bacterium]
MSYKLRFTQAARDDLLRLYEFQLDRDLAVAERALEAVTKALELLRDFPFSCRKATTDNSFLREMVIPFGSAGYVALFEIENDTVVTILAVRHQLEEDYH